MTFCLAIGREFPHLRMHCRWGSRLTVSSVARLFHPHTISVPRILVMNSVPLVALYALPPRHLWNHSASMNSSLALKASKVGQYSTGSGSTLSLGIFLSFWPWRTLSIVPTIAGSVVIVVRSLITIPLKSVCTKIYRCQSVLQSESKFLTYCRWKRRKRLDPSIKGSAVFEACGTEIEY